jgi:TP901 family phage tail tape measure protein
MKAFTIPSVFTAVDKITEPIKKMGRSVVGFLQRTEAEVARFERTYRNLGKTAWDVSKKAFIVGAAVAAPLIVAANDAIQFEDRMADVAKTTGLAGKELSKFGNEILALAPDTRTSIAELQQIAAIGGQMGVANDQLIGFTDSVNKFNVALGSDFSGGVEGAAKAISGLKGLFKETRDLRVDEAITKAGSAINALSAKGVVVPEVTEFVSRIGQLPDAIKPSIQNTAALAAVFNKAGITAEIASRAFGDILLTAAQNLPKFAKQMKLSGKEAANLINNDPTEFVNKFAQSLNGLDAQKLSKTLKGLKLTDAGAIKVVGALGSSTKMLAEFQGIANAEFAKGTSLLNEYNAKNNTTKANLEKAINNFKALSITIGTQLLPMVNDLISSLIPLFKGLIKFAKDNPRTVKTIIAMTIAFSALSFMVSGVAAAIGIYANIMLIANTATKLWTGAQWLLNVALTANPIGLIIVGIAALIAWIALVIYKWKEWGAAISLMMGPIGWLLNVVMSLYRNWEMIKKAFSEGSILDGIKAIGKVLLDAVLMPLQQILEIINSVTGADWAANAAKGIEMFRKDLGVQVDAPENPKADEQESLSQRIEKSTSQNVTIGIKDDTGRATVDSDNDLVPIKLSSTRTGF